MPVILAGPGTMQAVPQEEGVMGMRMSPPSTLHPLFRHVQKLSQLLLAEGKRVVVLEENQPVAGLTVLEQVGGSDSML